MTKKKKLKLSLIGCIVLTVLAPTVGIKVSFDRLIEYHEGRNEAETGPEGYYISDYDIDDDQDAASTNGSHYLGDIQDINRPGLTGSGIGFISLLGVIVFTVLIFKDRKESNKSRVQIASTGSASDSSA